MEIPDSVPAHGAHVNPDHGAGASRRILLCACGLSPQIVTETLHALAVTGQTPWIPDEIHLVTTREGEERARLTLLDGGDPEQQHFRRLCEDYGLPLAQIQFSPANIHVIRDAMGEPLEDIRLPVDNTATADAIIEVVRQLTRDPHSEIHASIAGGRKTMGFYLGYALSLLGREQDRISHVLVSDGAENHPQFFYPPRTSRVLYDRNNRPMEASRVRITLADIPFVRIGDDRARQIREAGLSFREAVQQVQRTLQPVRLALRAGARGADGKRSLVAVCDGIEVALKPTAFAFLLWFVRRQQQQQPALSRQDPPPEALAEFLHLHRAVSPIKGGDHTRVSQAAHRALSKGWFGDRFDTYKTDLKHQLGEKLNEEETERFLPQKDGKLCFALKLEPQALSVQLPADF